MEKQIADLKRAEQGVILSLLAYILQTVLKLTFGFFAGSQALIADGLHNLTDVLSSIAIIIGIRISMRPKDDDHPYGHLRAETVASQIVSILMMVIGTKVIIDSLGMLTSTSESPEMISAVVALLCSVMMSFVYLYSSRLAKKINSIGLMTTAKDNLADAIVGLGTAIGIFASQFGLPWIDPVVAVIVGVIIIKTGWEIFYESTHSLMDGIDKNKLDEISAHIRTVPGVKAVSGSRGRKTGNKLIIDVKIHVDPNLSVVEGHDIADLVQQKVLDEIGFCEAIVHVEPYMRKKS